MDNITHELYISMADMVIKDYVKAWDGVFDQPVETCHNN